MRFHSSIGDWVGERLGVFTEPEITSVSLNETPNLWSLLVMVSRNLLPVMLLLVAEKDPGCAACN